MKVKMLTVGSVYTNCYVVWCNNTKRAIVIDPGFESQYNAHKVLGVLEEHNLKTDFIVNTHGHPDHTCGNKTVIDATGAPLMIHKLDADLLNRPNTLFGLTTDPVAADDFLIDGGLVEFGTIKLRILHTPGHSPGSVSLIGENCVFTGDTLFKGSIGRVDLPGGSREQIMKSLKKLKRLSNETIVFPGHGPKSSIGEEKRQNPFLRMDIW